MIYAPAVVARSIKNVMEPNFDQPKTPEPSSLLEREGMKEFIESRKIAPEDFHLIEKIASISRNSLINNFHNLFNLSHEGSGPYIKELIRSAKDSGESGMYEAALEFFEKYGWATSYNLIRVLESNR